jgi:hypothetical protein
MFLHTKVIMLDLERHVAGSNHNSGVAFWNWDRLGQRTCEFTVVFFPALARQIAAGLEKVDAMAWHAASA